MDKMILIINWIIYGGLFGTFFIKLTDEKERDFCRKLAYFLLMFCSLFFSVSLFKQSFVFDENTTFVKVNVIETVFSALILFLMWTKVKEDKYFKK